tara:strand:+ start:319 stop:480 length:162 start_codon:yes stop_codon:yes gene_type:complete
MKLIEKILSGTNKAIAETIEVVINQTGIGEPIRYVNEAHELNKANDQKAKAVK